MPRLTPTLTAFSLLLALTFLPSPAMAQETILYSFGPPSLDAAGPDGSLIFDSAGNLYGTASGGGAFGGGAVFELSPSLSGPWTETIIYSFNPGLRDGFTPVASLIFDSVGNLYGTTSNGGTRKGGTVFELSPSSGGAWTETILHNFVLHSTTDGYNPGATLVMDSAGNLYGTTNQGGFHNGGIAFELSPLNGVWKEKLLHAFGSTANDGTYPQTTFTLDAAGNLYGTTTLGGTHSKGTVFELSPSTTGTWRETILHSFNNNNSDGASPAAGVIFDSAGNLYGTTAAGGANFAGAVFQLKPGGHWTESLIHSFTDQAPDGAFPQALPVLDSAGNLYGTAAGGGTFGDGMIFELSPAIGGPWTESDLYSFDESTGDGFIPVGALILDAFGNLYGTTSGGGTSGFGTVFQIAH